MKKNIPANEACDILCSLPVTLETERVGLYPAVGRVAAENVAAKIPVPPFDRSPYDGYAFRGDDTSPARRDSPARLNITEEIPAGACPSRPVEHGEAAKILTGAPIPDGADATIKYEETEYTESDVKIFSPVKSGTDIIRAGEDIKAGDLIARRGDVLCAPVVSLMASVGHDGALVYRKPVVTIINTGTELTRAGQPLPPGHIYSSSVYTLMGYLDIFGADPRDGGIVIDDPALIADRISAALESSDMVVTTGGASVGDYDFALNASERVGAKILFYNTDMKPGGAILACVKDGKLILGLSGSPGAAVLGLLRIARPYIYKLCGKADTMPQPSKALLKYPVTKNSPKMRIIRGQLEIENGAAYFAENSGQGNGSLSSLVDCDLLAEIPAGSPPLPAGAMVTVYRIDNR